MWGVTTLVFALVALVVNNAVNSVTRAGGVDLDLTYKIRVGAGGKEVSEVREEDEADCRGDGGVVVS